MTVARAPALGNESVGLGQLHPPTGGRETSRAARLLRVSANLVGAAGAAYFAMVQLQDYLHTHRLIGAGFAVEQMIVVALYLLRRPPRVMTRRSGDWVLAFGGTFTPVLLRPEGLHTQLGMQSGLVLQVAGLALCLWSFFALGRSFGFAAADRGLVQRGPYAVVRHPIYSSYLLLQGGYVLQSLSLRNLLVFAVASAFNVGRAIVEDEVLATNPAHGSYRARVRWRLVPLVW
jgi:protein-S-isoprenylcysteine O-methyltransferase Ste14